MIKLQLALDFRDLREAIRVADSAAAHVDMIEAGTPLIKSEGMQAVRTLRERYPDKILVADMKTMDTGFFEAEIAYDAGADIVTVLAAADRETIKGVAEAAKKHGKMLMVDTIGTEISDLPNKISGSYVDYVLVHCGIDQQNAGKSPFSQLQQLAELGIAKKIAVAGGIDSAKARMLSAYPRVEVAIVGSAITKANDPRKAAEKIRGCL